MKNKNTWMKEDGEKKVNYKAHYKMQTRKRAYFMKKEQKPKFLISTSVTSAKMR